MAGRPLTEEEQERYEQLRTGPGAKSHEEAYTLAIDDVRRNKIMALLLKKRQEQNQAEATRQMEANARAREQETLGTPGSWIRWMYQHYPYITAILNSSPRNNQGEQARIPDSGPFRDIAWSVIQNLLPKTEEMRKLFFMDANSPSGSTFHVASSYNDLARLAAPGTYLRRCFDWAESMFRRMNIELSRASTLSRGETIDVDKYLSGSTRQRTEGCGQFGASGNFMYRGSPLCY